MSDEITEKCGCGASITVPGVRYSTLVDWRANHRHERVATTAPDEHAPEVDVKGSASTQMAGHQRIGFTVPRNPSIESSPWW